MEIAALASFFALVLAGGREYTGQACDMDKQ
jgi:hypothetical protein